MARMTFKAGEEYALKLSKLEAEADNIAKRAIYEAANILITKIRENIVINLRDLRYVGKKGNVLFKNKYNETTGDLEKSLGIAKIQRDESGNWNTKIGFDGYDSKGVPNQLKARVMESGSSKIRKRPFVRPAVNATKDRAVAKMGQVIDEEIAKIFGGE